MFMYETLFSLHTIAYFMKKATSFLPISRNGQANTRKVAYFMKWASYDKMFFLQLMNMCDKTFEPSK